MVHPIPPVRRGGRWSPVLPARSRCATELRLSSVRPKVVMSGCQDPARIRKKADYEAARPTCAPAAGEATRRMQVSNGESWTWTHRPQGAATPPPLPRLAEGTVGTLAPAAEVHRRTPPGQQGQAIDRGRRGGVREGDRHRLPARSPARSASRLPAGKAPPEGARGPHRRRRRP